MKQESVPQVTGICKLSRIDLTHVQKRFDVHWHKTQKHEV